MERISLPPDVLRGEEISGHLAPAGQVDTVNGKYVDPSLNSDSLMWTDVLENKGVR